MPKLPEFISGFQSTVISTVDAEGNPFGSYAPFVVYQHDYYVFISDIARHARNLKAYPKASLFFIEDEAGCENIFARKRAVLQCESRIVPRETPGFDPVIQAFKTRFDSSLIDMLAQMQDFNLFRFTPVSGEAVFGFGQAYDVGGEFMDRLLARKSGGGHRKA